MDIWKIIGWIVNVGIVLLMISIIFLPFQLLSKYGFKLLFTVIVLGVLLLLHSALVFIQDIPKRKAGEKEIVEERTFLSLRLKTWKKIAEWTATIILVVIVLQFQSGSIGNKECPDLVRGNSQGQVVLQYFYSPFCPACWNGERIIQKLIEKYPSVRYENYDKRYCYDAMSQANVRGTPGYNLKGTNSSEIIYGVDAERIEQTLCRVGGCV